MQTIVQKEDFLKALTKLRPAQRPLSWQKNSLQKAQQILSKPYQPVKPHNIVLANGRRLTVPSAEDRIVQGAIHHALSSRLSNGQSQGLTFLTQELGKKLETAKNCWVLRCDFKDFFASLDHNHVLQELQAAIPLMDSWTLQAVKAVLSTSPKGLPQGSPLSPLLAEVSMRSIDTMLKKSNGMRYVDDVIILTSSPIEAAQQAEALSELGKPLGLTLNASKTQISEYPKNTFSFLGQNYPPSPEQSTLLTAPGGSRGIGLPSYLGERNSLIAITEGGAARKSSPSQLQFSKEYFLRSLTEKPSLDVILVLASVSPHCCSQWGKNLYKNRDTFLSANIAKPLHDSAFKLYVGKVKPRQASANPDDAARVLQALIVGNEILASGKFPTNYHSRKEGYQIAMEGLQAGNYEQYRQVVSKLFKENYQLRQKNSLPSISEYEESVVEHSQDPLEENINLP